MRLLRSLLFLCGLLLVACGQKTPPIVSIVESDVGAALFRQILADCPHATPDRKICLVIGPAQLSPSPSFLARFSDLKPRVLKPSQVTILNLGGKSRPVERSTTMKSGDLVLLLQVSELTSAGGNYEAVGAWAYKDDMMRRKYKISSQTDGTYKIEAGEILEEKSTPAPPA
jgi:hypothetical protein